MPKTPKILAIAGWLPSRVHPTLGNFVHRHVDALARKVEVHTLYITADESIERVEFEVVENQFYKGRIYYHPPGKWNHLKAIKQALAWVQSLDIDAVHAHILHEVFPILLSKAVSNKPIILSENWTGYHNGTFEQLPFWKKYFIRKAAKNIDLIAPVTPLLGERMRAFGLGNNFRIIENVVDTELFVPTQEEKQYTFIHISTLHDPHKNVSGIVRAFAAHLQNFPNSRMLIVGDGDIKPYQKLASELSIPEHNIHFKGIQPLSEIARLLRSAQYLVLFSNYENFPCVIPEAWASGVGIISTGVGGIHHYLNEKTGMEIPVRDEISLTDALNRCAAQDIFDSAYLRQYAEQEFSYEAIAQKFLLEFQKLLNA